MSLSSGVEFATSAHARFLVDGASKKPPRENSVGPLRLLRLLGAGFAAKDTLEL